jgi:hypothetical protein
VGEEDGEEFVVRDRRVPMGLRLLRLFLIVKIQEIKFITSRSQITKWAAYRMVKSP